MRAKQKETELGWRMQTQLQLAITGHGRTLNIAVAELPDINQWSLCAVESVSPSAIGGAAKSRGRESGLQAIFDDHSHQVLPIQPSLQAAIDLAERYAGAWLSDRTTAAARCLCQDIDRPKAKGRRKVA
jgi:hypothetical protein